MYVKGAFLSDESNIRWDRGQQGDDAERQQHHPVAVRSNPRSLDRSFFFHPLQRSEMESPEIELVLSA